MKLHKRIARRRGISMVEVVVALAVIMIVSAAATTLILRVSEVEGEVAHTMERNEQVENIIECYRWAKGDAALFTGALEEIDYDPYDSGSLRFYLTETDWVDVVLQKEDESNKLTGIRISGPNMDEDIIYG